jgi:hypothetical protein
MADPVDPLLAIVARCRAAFEEFGAASIAADDVAAEQDGREVTQEAKDRLEATSDALDAATKELISTAPVTKAGLAAAVAWLLEYDMGCIPDTSGRFLRTLAQSGFLNT